MALPRSASLPRFADRIAVGSLQLGPFCLGLVRDPRMIPAAFDAGINFFFVSADLHWSLYQPWRDGLAQLLSRGGGVRDSIVVAAATYMVHPPLMLAPFFELLDSVPKLDRIDVMVAGGCYGADFEPRVTALRDWRRRAPAPLAQASVGATVHERGALLRATGYERCDLAFVRYNPSHPRGRVDLYPHLSGRARKPLFSFKSMAGFRQLMAATPPGFWQPAPSDAYRYALSEPAHDGVLLSLHGERELDELASAVAKGPLSDDERTHLELLAEATRSARIAG